MENSVNRQQMQIDGERDAQCKSIQIEKRLKMNAKSGNIQK